MGALVRARARTCVPRRRGWNVRARAPLRVVMRGRARARGFCGCKRRRALGAVRARVNENDNEGTSTTALDSVMSVSKRHDPGNEGTGAVRLEGCGTRKNESIHFGFWHANHQQHLLCHRILTLT